MKKIVITILIGTVLMASCVPKNNAGQSANNNIQQSVLDVILKNGKIRVGTTGDFNPMSFIDPATNKYMGHDIDLVERLAKDMGVEIEYVKTDWKNLVSGISAGRYDISTSASYNMGRAKSAGYTLPVQQVGTVVLTSAKNATKYKSWASLNDPSIKVATTLGTVFDEQVNTLLANATKITVEAPARDYQELLAGRADISITSNIEAARLVKEYPELAILPFELQFSNVLGLLAPRGDQEFINYLNIWIRHKLAGGYFDSLAAKWLGQ